MDLPGTGQQVETTINTYLGFMEGTMPCDDDVGTKLAGGMGWPKA